MSKMTAKELHKVLTVAQWGGLLSWAKYKGTGNTDPEGFEEADLQEFAVFWETHHPGEIIEFLTHDEKMRILAVKIENKVESELLEGNNGDL